LLVGPVAARYRQIPVLLVTVSVMALSIALMLFNPVPDMSYLLAVPVIASYALCYPTLLSMFSESVDPTEQWWVMGVTIALFTIGSGGVSIVGGTMMKVSPGLPFVIAIASCILALILVAVLWRARGDIAALDPHKTEA